VVLSCRRAFYTKNVSLAGFFLAKALVWRGSKRLSLILKQTISTALHSVWQDWGNGGCGVKWWSTAWESNHVPDW
jgi:hypothetical protein